MVPVPGVPPFKLRPPVPLPFPEAPEAPLAPGGSSDLELPHAESVTKAVNAHQLNATSRPMSIIKPCIAGHRKPAYTTATIYGVNREDS